MFRIRLGRILAVLCSVTCLGSGNLVYASPPNVLQTEQCDINPQPLMFKGALPSGDFIPAGVYSFDDSTPLATLSFSECVDIDSVNLFLSVEIEEVVTGLFDQVLPHLVRRTRDKSKVDLYVNGVIGGFFEVEIKLQSGLLSCCNTKLPNSIKIEYISW